MTVYTKSLTLPNQGSQKAFPVVVILTDLLPPVAARGPITLRVREGALVVKSFQFLHYCVGQFKFTLANAEPATTVYD